MKDKTTKVAAALKKLAKDMGIHPMDVSKKDLLNSGLVSDWDLKMVGGVTLVKGSHFPVEGKELKDIVKMRKEKGYVSKLEKKLGEKLLEREVLLNSLKEAISGIKVSKFNTSVKKSINNNRKMTMELMLSDIHFGKKSETFDLAICRDRLRQLTTVLIREVEANQKLFNVEKIIVALLGDIIESYTMHGIESALGSEFSNSVQIKEAIESLFFDVILPIAELGIEVEIPAVTGNHDRTEHNRTMFNPGETNVTWIIYHALGMLIQQSGLKNVKMIIPKESYVVLNIYGNNCLYEHGDNFKGTSKPTIERLIQNRQQQVGKVIDFARFGHWHEYVCYGRGRIIINESVTGQDSYAKVLGFNSHAGQTINYYIETKDRPNCFYKSFPVYLM